MGWPMTSREAEEPATPVLARKDILTRVSIVVATLAAGIGLALWMMPGRVPPPRPPTAVSGHPPSRVPAAPAAPQLALRPRVVPPAPPPPAAPSPNAEAARPERAKAAPAPPPRVVVVERPAPARGPCEASDSRAEMLICTDPKLAAAERDDQRAARRAAAAGRRTNPAQWLKVREAAARQGPQALAEAYRRHTAALNRLAEPPH